MNWPVCGRTVGMLPGIVVLVIVTNIPQTEGESEIPGTFAEHEKVLHNELWDVHSLNENSATTSRVAAHSTNLQKLRGSVSYPHHTTTQYFCWLSSKKEHSWIIEVYLKVSCSFEGLTSRKTGTGTRIQCWWSPIHLIFRACQTTLWNMFTSRFLGRLWRSCTCFWSRAVRSYNAQTSLLHIQS